MNLEFQEITIRNFLSFGNAPQTLNLNDKKYQVVIGYNRDKSDSSSDRNGVGKSTIFNLLLRYFDATSGEIYIDDINIKDLTEKSLRNNISIVRQSPFLFNMSILDNFRLVKDDATLEEVNFLFLNRFILNTGDFCLSS